LAVKIRIGLVVHPPPILRRTHSGERVQENAFKENAFKENAFKENAFKENGH
jgi:hypothetical protein